MTQAIEKLAVDIATGTPKVPLFANVEDYRQFWRKTLFPCTLFTENQTSSNLIDFVLYERSPVFYFVQNEVERLAYFGCYGIIPVVHPSGPYLGLNDRYKDPVVASFHGIHEFAHNLFEYPRSIKDQTKRRFDNTMQANEYAASNFSEVVIYFIIPKLLELTKDAFFRPSWIDSILERGMTTLPNLAQLQEMRTQWIHDPETWGEWFAPGPRFKNTRDYMERFYNGNEDYNYDRMDRLKRFEGLNDPGLPSFDETDYLGPIEDYVPRPEEDRQHNYERTQMINIETMYKLLEIPNPPTSFAEAMERASELNDVAFVLSD